MDIPLRNLIIGAVLGALLAIIGGIIGQWLRMQLELWQERKFIKLGLADELDEIASITKRLKETFEKAGTTHKSYLLELKSNTACFDHHRRRLFILKGEVLRHKIVEFYRKLKDNIEESEGKVGTLAQTPEAKAEQKEIVTKLENFASEADTIKKSLTGKK